MVVLAMLQVVCMYTHWYSIGDGVFVWGVCHMYSSVVHTVHTSSSSSQFEFMQSILARLTLSLKVRRDRNTQHKEQNIRPISAVQSTIIIRMLYFGSCMLHVAFIRCHHIYHNQPTEHNVSSNRG